jgi:hypothetical protein
VTRSAGARIPPRAPRAAASGRAAKPEPSRSTMLARFTREAREALGPDATESQVAAAAETRRKAFYSRLSAAGVAARKAALRDALVRQRRSALAFAVVEASRDHRATRAGSPRDRGVAERQELTHHRVGMSLDRPPGVPRTPPG